MRTQVAVVDYGSQYTQLIVRRVRELGYYARLYQLHQIRDITDPAGIILSGGPRSTKEQDATRAHDELGLCGHFYINTR